MIPVSAKRAIPSSDRARSTSILSGKPEERRELFDEAAGIVKFKRRKSAAQKQLEEERQSLVRVNDIIAELERQKGPLEKQSETAKVYLQKKEELKLYDVNGFLMETQENRGQLKDLEEKLGHRVRTAGGNGAVAGKGKAEL